MSDKDDKKKEEDNLFVTSSNSKNKKRSKLLPFILILSIILGLIVFGYIYNIAGLRNWANEYDFNQKPNMVVTEDSKSFSNENNIIEESIVEEVENSDLNKDQDLFVEDKILEKAEIIIPKVIGTLKKIKDNIKEEIDINNQDKSKEPTEKVKEVDLFPDDKDINQEEIKEVDINIKELTGMDLSKEEYQKHREIIRDLKMGIYRGDIYVDELIAVKSLFPYLELPVIQKYSASGYKGRVKLAFMGVDAVEQSIISKSTYDEHKGLSWNSLKNFLKQFIQVKSTDKNIDLDNIKKAFQNGDFRGAKKQIQSLPLEKKELFNNVLQRLEDDYLLKLELKSIEDNLTSKLFSDG